MIEARGCYGSVHKLGTTKYPRKALLTQTGYKHAEKIYIDKMDGTAVHVGYIVGREWYTLYNVTPWEGNV